MNATSDNQHAVAPDGVAVRVALWRAVHVQIDPPPHVLEDEIGLKLADPEDRWRHRSDMDPQFTRLFRASNVARARFIEDLVMPATSRRPRLPSATSRAEPMAFDRRIMRRNCSSRRRGDDGILPGPSGLKP
jgi:hypothetical protein